MKKVFLILLFIFAFSQIIFSQAICPIATLKVNKVSGKIIDNGRLATSISNVKVELRKFDDKETFISTTATNENGEFEFSAIKKGKYVFNVYFVFEGFYLKYRTILKVKKSNSSKTKPSILIQFAGDCFETETTTIG